MSKSRERMLNDLPTRFWAKVKKQECCWLWTGYLDECGYGRFAVRHKGKFYPTPAQRIAWELANGAIPPGMAVMHRCDFPSCVNPAHLELGTKSDNMRDRWRKGRKRINSMACSLSGCSMSDNIYFRYKQLLATRRRRNASESS